MAGPAYGQEGTLHFPSLEPNANVGEQLDSGHYFHVQMKGALLRSEAINILTHHRSRYNLPHSLSEDLDTISKLLFPGVPYPQRLTQNGVIASWTKDLRSAFRGWRKVLDGTDDPGPLLTEDLRMALASAPNMLLCQYMLNSENSLVDPSSWKEVNAKETLYFWADDVPPALQPEALHSLTKPVGGDSGVHPFIVIGPQVSSCPPTFGQALALIAPQLPGQIPAMDPTFPQQVAETTGWAAAAAENKPDISYLPRSQAHHFKDILKSGGQAGSSAGNKIGFYLAFHRAFASACKSEMNDSWSEYMFTRQSDRLDLREVESIWLESSVLDEFYLAASSLVPVVILEHEGDPIQDFGSRDPNESIHRIYEIRAQHDAETQAHFTTLLKREGCGSDIAKAFHKAVSDNLPQMQVKKGESTVSMFHRSAEGAPRSVTFMLNAPYDPDSMRATGMISSTDSGLFPLGGDYGGRMLSYLALGDFTAARNEQQKSVDETLRQIRSMGPPGYNPIAALYEKGFQIKESLGPYNALITSYIIRRVQILGACGDPLVPVTRNYVEIETTRNGFGTEIRSREVARYQDHAVVPVDFKHIVDREDDITPGAYSRALVDGAIGRLSCDSEMRRNLEANMIAFNKGAAPVWTNPENKMTFGSSSATTDSADNAGKGADNAGKGAGARSGESAYVYSNAKAAEKLIEDAARNADSNLSLEYTLSGADDRSAATLNLLRIKGIPAIAFNTRYIGKKSGSSVSGRTAGLLMTCAGNGKLEISQLLMSSEPNNMSENAKYNLVYRAYGLGGQWPVATRLESDMSDGGEFTFARFRGQMNADEKAFAGLRLTSNFEGYVTMGPGKRPLSWGVDGGRVNTTLAPLIDHCRSTAP
jgi:hypothetical protein